MHPVQIPPPLPSSHSQTALARLPSIIQPRAAGTHKREENGQLDLQEAVKNLIWSCFSCCQPWELLAGRNGMETNGSPVQIQQCNQQIAGKSSSLDEGFREACRHVWCRSLSRYFLHSSHGWSCDFEVMTEEMFGLLEEQLTWGKKL